MNVVLMNNVVSVAKSYVNQEEIVPNKGFKDKFFELKMKAVGWLTGQPWCAYFTELVWKEAFEKSALSEYIPVLNKLFSGSVVAGFRNFKTLPADFLVSSEPSVGALVFWQSVKNPANGHTGIVVGVNADGTVETIEGNTNAKGSREGFIVTNKKRAKNGYSGVKLLGYVTFKK